MNRRRLALTLIAFSIPAAASAQTPLRPVVVRDLTPDDVREASFLERSSEYRSGKRRRTVGIVLATAGPAAGGLLALGGYLLINSARNDSSSCDDATDQLACGVGSGQGTALKGIGGLAIAAVGAAVGVGTLAAGIPLIVSGQRKMNRARQNLAPELSFAAAPGEVALGARWRF